MFTELVTREKLGPPELALLTDEASRNGCTGITQQGLERLLDTPPESFEGKTLLVTRSSILHNLIQLSMNRYEELSAQLQANNASLRQASENIEQGRFYTCGPDQSNNSCVSKSEWILIILNSLHITCTSS